MHKTRMRMQCPDGQYSASAATACSACPAGKYRVNIAGGTEVASCAIVS